MLSSCDPHEFPPDGQDAPSLNLSLHFNTDFLVYKEVAGPGARSQRDPEVAYTVWGWRCIDGNKPEAEPDMILNRTGGDIGSPDIDIRIDDIEPGSWKFVAWAHLCDAGTHEPLAYTVNSPESISLTTSADGEFAAMPWSDAFRGDIEVTVNCAGHKEVVLDMNRPVGGFEFLTSDIDKFIDNEITRTRQTSGRSDVSAGGPSRVIDLGNYSVGYHIQGYYPSEFDNVRNVPVDARTGLYARGMISDNGDGTGKLGGCMVFVNGHETVLTVVLTVYDREEVIVTSAPVDIPVVRGKRTLVKGEFLTRDAGSGIGICPDFYGDFNYPIF